MSSNDTVAHDVLVKENSLLKSELKQLRKGTDAVATGVRNKILELKEKVEMLTKENKELRELLD